jgi:hypothetical protein
MHIQRHKQAILYLLVGMGLFFCASMANAIDLGFSKTDDAAQKAGYGQTDETTFASKIGIVMKASISVVGVIFLALMVYAGFLWMTAQGEEEPITKAKKIILACIIGLVIVAGSYSLTVFVVPTILKKTTGKSGGMSGYESGAPKVECCEFCGFFTCDPPKQISEADCKQLDGKYKGLVPANQCE